MTRSSIAKFLNLWTFKREEERRRLDQLRKRDGDDCRRCRRPLRFDLPRGHDRAPIILQILPEPKRPSEALENLCLCHSRCNRDPGDSTPEVRERRRLRQVDDPASLPWG